MAALQSSTILFLITVTFHGDNCQTQGGDSTATTDNQPAIDNHDQLFDNNEEQEDGLENPLSGTVRASCHGHIENHCYPHLDGECVWSCRSISNDTWIEVNFHQPVAIGGVTTQGNPDTNQRVTRYFIDWKPSVSDVNDKGEDTSHKIVDVTNEISSSSKSYHSIPAPFVTESVKFQPIVGEIDLRFEILGNTDPCQAYPCKGQYMNCVRRDDFTTGYCCACSGENTPPSHTASACREELFNHNHRACTEDYTTLSWQTMRSDAIKEHGERGNLSLFPSTDVNHHEDISTTEPYLRQDMVSTDTIQVSWNTAPGAAFYELTIIDQSRNSQPTTIRNTVTTDHAFQNRTPGQSYSISLTANDANGDPIIRDQIVATTIPLPPQNIKVTTITPTISYIEWESPAAGVRDGYLIEYGPRDRSIQPTRVPISTDLSSYALNNFRQGEDFVALYTTSRGQVSVSGVLKPNNEWGAVTASLHIKDNPQSHDTSSNLTIYLSTFGGIVIVVLIPSVVIRNILVRRHGSKRNVKIKSNYTEIGESTAAHGQKQSSSEKDQNSNPHSNVMPRSKPRWLHVDIRDGKPTVVEPNPQEALYMDIGDGIPASNTRLLQIASEDGKHAAAEMRSHEMYADIKDENIPYTYAEINETQQGDYFCPTRMCIKDIKVKHVKERTNYMNTCVDNGAAYDNVCKDVVPTKQPDDVDGYLSDSQDVQIRSTDRIVGYMTVVDKKK